LRLQGRSGEDMGFTTSSISYQKWRLILDNTRGNHQELALEPSWLAFGLRIIINYPHRDCKDMINRSSRSFL
jgi:hypothetical protein